MNYTASILCAIGSFYMAVAGAVMVIWPAEPCLGDDFSLVCGIEWIAYVYFGLAIALAALAVATYP